MSSDSRPPVTSSWVATFESSITCFSPRTPWQAGLNQVVLYTVLAAVREEKRFEHIRLRPVLTPRGCFKQALEARSNPETDRDVLFFIHWSADANCV